MASDIVNTSGTTTGNQRQGRVTVASGGRGTNFALTYDPAIETILSPIADITTKYDHKFLDTWDDNVTPLGFEQLAVSTTSVGFVSIPIGATKALIDVRSNAIRWRDDGVDPTATIGVQVDADKQFWYEGNLSEIEFIRVSSDAALNISYYG